MNTDSTKRMLRTEFYPTQATRDTLQPEETLTTPDELPVSMQGDLENPKDYIADDGLAEALNVALVLNQPLLLTGEPGSGKTQFAYSAMHWLGFRRLLRFNVKSTTQARDFFYQIDELRRFRDAQLLNLRQRANRTESLFTADLSQEPEETRPQAEDPLAIGHYMTLGPLGEAILRANPPVRYPSLPQPSHHEKPERSIVLIDEIDKAPRDVPNDLLNEFENMEFSIPELNETIRADHAYRPVLIITSNSERNLPDTFLRRCIYYNIAFPGEEASEDSRSAQNTLLRIVHARLPAIDQETVWLQEALELFRLFRERGRGIQKLPGTAEFFNWLLVLHRQQNMMVRGALKRSPDLFYATLTVLMKNKSDADIARRIYQTYQNS